MSLEEFGTILGRMYADAPPNDKAAMVHLFGVIYANQIKAARAGGITYKQIAMQAGLTDNWGAEISKGVRLEKYVSAKKPSRPGFPFR